MTQPVQEPTTERDIGGLGWRTAQLARRPSLFSTITVDYALLAIPDGQTISSGSLDVITDYNRSAVAGTALSVNAATGLITINEEGIYDVHTWALMDNVGAWDIVEGPVFQGGQDYQDIGNGLDTHRPNANYPDVQHKTTFFVADLPQSVNLQVFHNRGSSDDLVNGGLTVVRIAPYIP
jgi:hypothetical protein